MAVFEAWDGERQDSRAPTVEWNETAAMAVGRMRAADVASLVVMGGRGRLGRITLAEIERCRSQGNWLDAVLVRDLVCLPAPPALPPPPPALDQHA